MDKRFYVLWMILLVGCTSSFRQQYQYISNTGNVDEIRRFLEQRIRIVPDDGESILDLAEIYAKEKNWPAVVKTLGKAEKCGIVVAEQAQVLKESLFSEEINSATTFYNKTNFLQAIAHLQAAVILASEDFIAQRLYAESLLKTGDTTAATVQFISALEINPDNIQCKQFLADIFVHNKQYDKAALYARRILKTEKTNINALRILAYSLEISKRHDAALTAFKNLTDHSKKFKDFEGYAVLLYKQGKIKESKEIYLQSLKYATQPLKVYRAIAQCQIVLQQFDGLINTANKILTLNKEDIDALQLLMVAYGVLGQEKELEKLQDKLSLLPDRKKVKEVH